MLAWGNFLTIVINFVIIAWVLFMVVRGINRLQRKEAEKPAAPAAPTKQEVLLHRNPRHAGEEAGLRSRKPIGTRASFDETCGRFALECAMHAARARNLRMNDLSLKPQRRSRRGAAPRGARAPESGIVEVDNYGRGREGLIPLWAGEGDLPTPAFICEAATRALAAGETFYTWQRGIPRAARGARALSHALYGRTFAPEEFFVTGSGMQAIQIVLGDGRGRRRRGADPDAGLAELRRRGRHRRRARRRGADVVRQ